MQHDNIIGLVIANKWLTYRHEANFVAMFIDASECLSCIKRNWCL